MRTQYVIQRLFSVAREPVLLRAFRSSTIRAASTRATTPCVEKQLARVSSLSLAETGSPWAPFTVVSKE